MAGQISFSASVSRGISSPSVFFLSIAGKPTMGARLLCVSRYMQTDCTPPCKYNISTCANRVTLIENVLGSHFSYTETKAKHAQPSTELQSSRCTMRVDVLSTYCSEHFRSSNFHPPSSTKRAVSHVKAANLERNACPAHSSPPN